MVPTPVRAAGALAVVESAIVLAYSVFLIVRDLLGYRDPSAVFEDGHQIRGEVLGIGTALCLIAMFGAVAWAGWSYMRGKRWGRGLVFFTNIMFLPVSWYIFQSGQLLAAIVVAIVALIGIGLLLHPESVGYTEQAYGGTSR